MADAITTVPMSKAQCSKIRKKVQFEGFFASFASKAKNQCLLRKFRTEQLRSEGKIPLILGFEVHTHFLLHTFTNFRALCKGSYLCSCKSGYRVSKRNPNECEDINECQTDNGGCLQKCDNLPGSFQCSCNHGYEGMYVLYILSTYTAVLTPSSDTQF